MPNGIRYNFLDKPEEIHITGKGTINLTYDADGNKLQKKYTPENTAIAATTFSTLCIPPIFSTIFSSVQALSLLQTSVGRAEWRTAG